MPGVLRAIADLLRPSGQALFNIFLADAGFEPDELLRQMSQAAWATLFTPAELHHAIANLPLKPIADDFVLEYEKTHLPPEAWPPTPWFETWCRGRSVIHVGSEKPPFQMHWILLRHA